MDKGHDFYNRGEYRSWDVQICKTKANPAQMDSLACQWMVKSLIAFLLYRFIRMEMWGNFKWSK